ncbi:hypothetical protein [Paenibacillus turpanensis]|uniref:hypothetical protein n=1 Tax=Paenibacillus turpanensis TaxID=2689078 RepID=UPI00140DCA3F|nr:hypothetical protein [Paenibacillus turpanensis]
MERTNTIVPFGYEPQMSTKKGTLFYYDTFERADVHALSSAIALAESRSFSKMVFYPLHEETVKRMTKEAPISFYKRERLLLEFMEELGETRGITVEGWEGKRKKYTPMDTALRFLTEKYPGPHFFMLPGAFANLFATYATFEEWIRTIRLVIVDPVQPVHPNLLRFESRWERFNP